MGELFLYKEDGTEKIVGIPDYSYFTDKENEFELIEEQEEIDIQNIEELSCYEECTTRGDIIEKINELIQAIKQIDKKIKEM